MRYAHPCLNTPHEGGELAVSFPDAPEALTSGYSRAEELQAAAEALSVMLAGRVEDGKAIPVPSPALDGQEIVTADTATEAKPELYSTVREQGISKSAPAERPGLFATSAGRANPVR